MFKLESHHRVLDWVSSEIFEIPYSRYRLSVWKWAQAMDGYRVLSLMSVSGLPGLVARWSTLRRLQKASLQITNPSSSSAHIASYITVLATKLPVMNGGRHLQLAAHRESQTQGPIEKLAIYLGSIRLDILETPQQAFQLDEAPLGQSRHCRRRNYRRCGQPEMPHNGLSTPLMDSLSQLAMDNTPRISLTSFDPGMACPVETCLTLSLSSQSTYCPVGFTLNRQEIYSCLSLSKLCDMVSC